MRRSVVKSHSLSNEFQEYFSLHSDEDDKEINDELLQFYSSTNKLMEKEIEALKCNLKEAEQDIVTLKSNQTELSYINTKNSKDVELENNGITEIRYHSTKDNDADIKTQEDQEEKQLNQLKVLSRDIMYTKKEMLCIREEENYYKNQIDILNEVLLHLLESKSGKKTENWEKLIDFERILTDSLKLSTELNLENIDLSKVPHIDKKERRSRKAARGWQHRYGLSGCNSQGLFSIDQVERILKTLKREKKYLDETNLEVWSKFLEKLLIELLQKHHDKSLCNQNQDKKRRSLNKRLRYLEKLCCLDDSNQSHIDESQSSADVFDLQLVRTKGNSDFDEDVRIDFEQPISLVNPNYIPPSDQI